MLLLQGKHVWPLVVKLWQCTQCADSSVQTKDMKQPPAASDHIKAAAGTLSHRHAEAQPPNECLTDSYTRHCSNTTFTFMLYISDFCHEIMLYHPVFRFINLLTINIEH